MSYSYGIQRKRQEQQDPSHQHVGRNLQIQQIIFEAPPTLTNLEDFSQATPGLEHGLDVGAFDGAAEAIPELLHVGPFATGRSLELHRLGARFRERFFLQVIVAGDAQPLRHCL